MKNTTRLRWMGGLGLLSSSLMGQTALAAPAVTTGLTAAYEFTGDANDTSGNGRNATVYGATLTTDRFGNANSAYSFDGNDYIQTTVNSNINPLSFSVWFNLSNTTGERSIVDSDVGGAYGHSLIQGYNDGDGTIDVQYHNGYIDTSFALTANTWYHAVVNYGSNIELYINGNLIVRQTYNPTTYDGSAFRIGRHNASDPQWLVGKVDDVYFYNRTLTQQEITSLYSATPVPEPTTTALMGLGLMGVWGARRKAKNRQAA